MSGRESFFNAMELAAEKNALLKNLAFVNALQS